MAPLLQTLLFAATASAQLTTSLWMIKWGLSEFDKYGFVGSVVGVAGPRTTLAITFDNGTDTSAFGFATSANTVTVGPGYFEIEDSVGPGPSSRQQRINCAATPTPTDASVKCTRTRSPDLERGIECNGNSRLNSTSLRYFTETYTYSGRGTYSAGVETFTRTVTYKPASTPPPEWCKTKSYLPSSGLVNTFDLPATNFATFQVVITAGTEKLNATAGASPSAGSVSPTRGSGSPNPAGPKRTAAPMLMGLGAAAVAAFL